MTATPQTLLKFLVGAAITAAILFVVWYFSSIVIYILVSAVLAIMGRPLVDWLARVHVRQWRIPRGIAALITLLLIWVLFATFCTLFVPLVFDKVYQFSTLDFSSVLQSIEDPVQHVQEYLHSFFAIPDAQVSLAETLVKSLGSIVNLGSINTIFSSIVGLTVSSVIALFSISFITFFFLKDEGLFFRMVIAIFPSRYAENVQRALDSITVLLSRYFVGILSESTLLLIAVSLTMMAFGMPASDAFFIGLIMGVMNVVPYAGPLIGGIISAFLGVVSPIEGMTIGHTVFTIVASLLVIKSLDDFVLQPTLYSERVKAHPLEVFLVILIAGSVAGILGMLLAIPSYTVLRVFAKEFFSQYRLVRQLTDKI